jgi:hypothetical protein
MGVLTTLVLGLSLFIDCTPRPEPQGVVYHDVDAGRPIISVGSKKGAYKGALFDVQRDGRRVGRLRVRQVYPDDSEVDVIEDLLGIRGGDALFLVRGAAAVHLDLHRHEQGRVR